MIDSYAVTPIEVQMIGNLKSIPAGIKTKGESQMVNLNQATSITDEELKNVMDYHPWDDAKIAKGNAVRTALSNALRVIIENVPPSPDRSAAIRKLRDARMDCNSAITHNGAY